MQVGAKRDKGMKGILIMEKITIKNFIDEYIRDYIEITKYVPFTQKLVRAKNLN